MPRDFHTDAGSTIGYRRQYTTAQLETIRRELGDWEDDVLEEDKRATGDQVRKWLDDLVDGALESAAQIDEVFSK